MATATSSRTCPVDYVLFPAPPKPMPSLFLFPMEPAAEAAPPGEQAAGHSALGLAAAVRQWLRGLMREPKKWTIAYDDGGWRYEFQTSNMAESFNSVLKGIRAMPVNAIVAFTFYMLVAWFNDRHAQAIVL